jgi:hypothetical protein
MDPNRIDRYRQILMEMCEKNAPNRVPSPPNGGKRLKNGSSTLEPDKIKD